jgi:predicted ATP-binding protein involved in virulence
LYLPIKAMKTLGSSLQIIYLESLKNKMSDLAVKGVREEIFKDKDKTLKEGIKNGLEKLTKALMGITLTTKLVDVESEKLIFQSANNQRITFDDLSNGEQTLYFRAIYLSQLNPQNSIIMIDEPENALHPTWQQNIMKLYQNIGENNQIIVATHSPHIIGSSNAEEVFLLEIDDNQVEAVHPRYTKGHSIDYILEVMGANPRDTIVINKIDAYLALIRKGAHETAIGFKLKSEIDALNLDPNGDEMRRLDLSLRRFKAIGV